MKPTDQDDSSPAETTEMDDKYWEEYESGPYCQHWSELGDCEDVCKTCGHQCREHDAYDETQCNEDGCDCKGFVDSD